MMTIAFTGFKICLTVFNLSRLRLLSESIDLLLVVLFISPSISLSVSMLVTCLLLCPNRISIPLNRWDRSRSLWHRAWIDRFSVLSPFFTIKTSLTSVNPQQEGHWRNLKSLVKSVRKYLSKQLRRVRGVRCPKIGSIFNGYICKTGMVELTFSLSPPLCSPLLLLLALRDWSMPCCGRKCGWMSFNKRRSLSSRVTFLRLAVALEMCATLLHEMRDNTLPLVPLSLLENNMLSPRGKLRGRRGPTLLLFSLLLMMVAVLLFLLLLTLITMMVARHKVVQSNALETVHIIGILTMPYSLCSCWRYDVGSIRCDMKA